MPEWVTVAKTEEVPEDALLQVSVDEAEVLLANVGGAYRAIGRAHSPTAG